MTARTLGEINNRLVLYRSLRKALASNELEPVNEHAIARWSFQIAQAQYFRSELKKDLISLYHKPQKTPLAYKLLTEIVEVL